MGSGQDFSNLNDIFIINIKYSVIKNIEAIQIASKWICYKIIIAHIFHQTIQIGMIPWKR
jgi:hypothetical protein